MGVLKNPIIWAAVAVFSLYWVAAFFVPTRPLIEFTDGIAIAMSGAVMVVYGRRVIESLLHSQPDMYDLIILGIAGGWLTNCLDRMWRLTSRVLDLPHMINSPSIGFGLVSLAFFASLHLIVRGPPAHDVANRSSVSTQARATIVVALLVGIAIGVLAVSIDWHLFGWWG